MAAKTRIAYLKKTVSAPATCRLKKQWNLPNACTYLRDAIRSLAHGRGKGEINAVLKLKRHKKDLVLTARSFLYYFSLIILLQLQARKHFRLLYG